MNANSAPHYNRYLLNLRLGIQRFSPRFNSFHPHSNCFESDNVSPEFVTIKTDFNFCINSLCANNFQRRSYNSAGAKPSQETKNERKRSDDSLSLSFLVCPHERCDRRCPKLTYREAWTSELPHSCELLAKPIAGAASIAEQSMNKLFRK